LGVYQSLVVEETLKQKTAAQNGTAVFLFYARLLLLYCCATLKLALEALNASSCVDKALFAGVSRVTVGGYIAHHNVVLDSVDFFGAVALHGGERQKLFACRNILKADRVGFGVASGFHK
jgi:hypothetical protein